METKVSLLTNIIDSATHYRTSRAVILLTVENRNLKHRYEVETEVTLYDAKFGPFLRESTTLKQMIKDGEDYMKFDVDIGPENVIKKCKLQLRVKVKVIEYNLESTRVQRKEPVASLHSPEADSVQHQKSSDFFSHFEEDSLSSIECKW